MSGRIVSLRWQPPVVADGPQPPWSPPRSCKPQHYLLRYSVKVPVSIAEKVESISQYLGSQRRLADLIGVDRAQVTRWRQGEQPSIANAVQVDTLELVFSELSRVYAKDAATQWLHGVNPHLGDRRPIDVIRHGRPEDLLAALRMELAGSPA